jgi:lipopolysaccharide export system protein LptA
MRGASLAAAFVALAAYAGAARAQGGADATGAPAKVCLVRDTGVVVNGVVTTHLTIRKDTTYFGGGVNFWCDGTDQRVIADSAEHYENRKLLILMGHVHYTETRLKLDADRMTYFTAEERLLAEGNVVGVTNTGTRFTGPRAEYLRPAVGVRTKSHLLAEPRANIWVSPQDAGKDSKDSVNIQANRIIMDNDSLIYAKGLVVIERPDLLSTSDSAFVDKYTEFARLTQTPKVVGRGDRHFTLDGDVIDIYSKEHEVERVKSLGHGLATSDDITLKSDTIDLRVSGQKLQRAFSWGKSRAHAHSKDQEITADSIDVVMPDQTLRMMRSVGSAVAESMPDSLKIVSKKLDRLAGDTVIAVFDSLTAADTAKQPAIKTITAYGTQAKRATSYYQVARNGEPKTDRPNVNYTLADTITATFRQRQIYRISNQGHVEGFYDELATDTSKTVKKDSTTLKPAKKPAATKKP